MIIPWLDEMVKTGSVRPEVRDEICKTCDGLVKHAGKVPADVLKGLSKRFKGKSPVFKEEHPMATLIGSTAGATASMPLMKKFEDHQAVNSTVANVQQAKLDLVNMPEFKQDREKAEARFNEIVKVAPSVAGNKALLTKLMRSRLHSGLSTNDINNLSIMQHAMTPAPGAQDKIHQKLGGATLATVYKILEENGLTKEAAPSSKYMTLLKNTAVLSSIPLLAGAGLGTVQHVVAKKDAKQLRELQDRTFAEAVRRAPEDSPLHTDPKATRQAYDTLVHFAPNVATEPNAAGAFMKKLIEYKELGTQPDDVKTLTDIERNIANARRPGAFASGLQTGATSLGLNRIMQSAIGKAGDVLEGGAV